MQNLEPAPGGDSPRVRPLPMNEVHVWRAALEPRASACRWHALLSADELARWQRYQRDADRIRFGVARGILRLLLSQYCGTPAAAIQFEYSAHGKPSLAGDAQLQFSVSHTDGMAIYALARGRRVGIDIERVRDVPDRDRLVSRNFASEEAAEYHQLPAEARQRGFFNGWTRKEAFVKALGEGLHHDLAAFAVALTPGEPARLLRTQFGDPDAWTIHDLTADDRFIAALAVEGTDLRVHRWQWPESGSFT